MPRKSSVPRVPDAEPPAMCCSECWFYEPKELDHGACYGVPPTPIPDTEGDMMYPRPIVFADDRGCTHWRARHRA